MCKLWIGHNIAAIYIYIFNLGMCMCLNLSLLG